LPFAARRSPFAMTADTPPSPLVPDAPETDQVGLAVRAVGAAFATAIGWLGFITWGTTRLRGDAGPTVVSAVDPNAAHVNLLLYGLTAGLALAGIVGWLLLRPVASGFRRFGLTMVGVLGGVSLAMLVTFFASELGGAPALLGTGIVGLMVAVVLARAARRAARQGAAA
jgi:hypothetical protein